MTSFEDRERAFENKYAHDQEMQFKAIARRDRLAGLWAAEKMGLFGPDAEDYAKQVVRAQFEEPGDEDVIRKLMGDLQAKNVPITREQIVDLLAQKESEAKAQLAEG